MKRTHDAPPWRRLAIAAAALVLSFGAPLWRLICFAVHSELDSYVLTIPLIAAGLIWLRRSALPPPSAPARAPAAVFLIPGAALAAANLAGLGGPAPALRDSLCLSTLAFVLLFIGLCGWFLGGRTFRALAFPLGLLVLTAPLPSVVCDSLQTFLQHTSAAVAYWFFEISGTPVFRERALVFRLPGVNLEVAPECSGIHSSIALIVTSLPAGYLLLRSPWKRTFLTLAVVPLGIARNGFRIFTIGELCVHIGPQMINSYIHRTGGWMFFLLSLVPFLIVLFLLARLKRPAAPSENKPAAA